MKTIRNSILCLCLTLGAMSCNDNFLVETDPNSVATSNYFKNENDVLLAVNGAYQALRNNSGLAEGSMLYSEERSDNTGRNDNQSNAGEPFQFNDFALLPSNTYLKTHWLALYQIITRTNLVLDGIEKVTFSNATTKAQYQAEAKFIRALVYFHLVRKWGDVPLVTKPLSSSDEVKANTAREKKDKVYAQIVADLTDVVNSSLPDHQPVANKGRVSKVAGMALLGQVYLTMATTLDAANRTTNLNQAKTYLTGAYDKRTFGLLKEISYTDVFDVAKKSTNPEIIFQIVYKQGDINYASNIAVSTQAQGENINSLRTTTGTGGNVTPDLVKEYEEGDLRKDFSIKYANAANVKDYFITKYRDVSAAAGANGYGGNDWILMRYADVILMLAEVNLYLGNDAAAISFLNQVRERAKMPLYEVVKETAAYKAKFPSLKMAILHERRIELAFENHRWFDLLRFFKPAELVTYMGTKLQADFGAAKISNFGLKDYYYPIPFDEFKLDPVKMYQNEGY
ncbi:RagB/SusD family nutrient uptake outer membrane protein [Runella salmonicolor]|uniref:RagB/SusD family nutrient uptake outer membrane protein n=1 Tax=Runella salmonicolor TaxID=2950278 RepID=A0ABT1FXM1_9BACT|nr:RagB/SusD family nutrient uptake outer membrane protein [Runella salmonicolor]MCP1386494.1 RagB/SusD family nutrient uptake outer membrane protein [Runella salmonicolor]